FVLGLAGIAVWTLAQFARTAQVPTPPALSVAILPLAAPHGDADASRFAEALTRNLMTGVPSKRSVGRVLVVSGRPGEAEATATVGVRDLGRRLNVRYLLEGDVLRSAGGNSVNLRLVNAA